MNNTKITKKFLLNEFNEFCKKQNNLEKILENYAHIDEELIWDNELEIKCVVKNTIEEIIEDWNDEKDLYYLKTFSESNQLNRFIYFAQDKLNEYEFNTHVYNYDLEKNSGKKIEFLNFYNKKHGLEETYKLEDYHKTLMKSEHVIYEVATFTVFSEFDLSLQEKLKHENDQEENLGQVM
ncbi:hypothetical protein ACW95P_01880 [Candidatus Mycoplasma pogonae]